jgi:hypothetical protein
MAEYYGDRIRRLERLVRELQEEAQKKPSIQDLLKLFQEASSRVAHQQPGLTVSSALCTVAQQMIERLDSES